jgi:hypothetical protein
VSARASKRAADAPNGLRVVQTERLRLQIGGGNLKREVGPWNEQWIVETSGGWWWEVEVSAGASKRLVGAC